jgi:hypothetical protein
MPRNPLLMRTLLLLLTLLLSAAFAGASAARTAVAPVGGPSANNTVTKIQAWLEDQVSVSYSVRNWKSTYLVLLNQISARKALLMLSKHITPIVLKCIR